VDLSVRCVLGDHDDYLNNLDCASDIHDRDDPDGVLWPVCMAVVWGAEPAG
jgi:hypothetical protein